MSELVVASALNIAALPAMTGATSSNGRFPRLSDTLDIAGVHLGALSTVQVLLLGIGVGAVAVLGLAVVSGRVRRRLVVRRTAHRPTARTGQERVSSPASARHVSSSADLVDVDHASLPAGKGATARADKQIVELAEHVARRLAKNPRSANDPDLKAQNPT